MKIPVAKQAEKKKPKTFIGRKTGRRTARIREVIAGGVSEPLHYDAEDIKESNRLGAALCRQHAP